MTPLRSNAIRCPRWMLGKERVNGGGKGMAPQPNKDKGQQTRGVERHLESRLREGVEYGPWNPWSEEGENEDRRQNETGSGNAWQYTGAGLSGVCAYLGTGEHAAATRISTAQSVGLDA